MGNDQFLILHASYISRLKSSNIIALVQARGLTMRVFEHLFARISELQQACSPPA